LYITIIKPGEYKHSLTLHVWRYAVIPMKPVHRLQVLHNTSIWHMVANSNWFMR